MLSSHARKRCLDVDDVRLGASMIQERNTTCPVSRHVLSNMARTRNNHPLLTPAPNKHGLRLPADRFCTVGVNYRYGHNMETFS